MTRREPETERGVALDTCKTNYRERLALVVQCAYEEYRIITVDTPNRQQGLIKTYLWLSSLIIAFDLSVYSELLQKKFEISFLARDPECLFTVTAIIALISSLAAFGIATWATFGRGVVKMPLGADVMEFARKAKDDAEKGEFRTYNTLIKSLDVAIDGRMGYVSSCSLLLRFTSAFCFASLIFSLLSYVFFMLGL